MEKGIKASHLVCANTVNIAKKKGKIQQFFCFISYFQFSLHINRVQATLNLIMTLNESHEFLRLSWISGSYLGKKGKRLICPTLNQKLKNRGLLRLFSTAANIGLTLHSSGVLPTSLKFTS